MPQHNSPDRNASDEQRQAHQRSCFLKDCAEDGLAGVISTERRPLEQYEGRVVFAKAPATAAATRQAMSIEHGRTLQGETASLQPVKEP